MGVLISCNTGKFCIVDKEVFKRVDDRGFQGQGFLEIHACSSPFDPTADVASISLNLNSWETAETK